MIASKLKDQIESFKNITTTKNKKVILPNQYYDHIYTSKLDWLRGILSINIKCSMEPEDPFLRVY